MRRAAGSHAASSAGAGAIAGEYPSRQQRRGDPALGDIDDDDPDRKPCALRAQRIGGAGIAAALYVRISTRRPQVAHDETSDNRAEKIGEQDLDRKFHGR
jgi:hypothetical protein